MFKTHYVQNEEVDDAYMATNCTDEILGKKKAYCPKFVLDFVWIV